MALAIDLIGKPHISIDGQETGGLRGRKAWGLLAYLLLTGSPPSRERLAALLFADADDPLGALRWNLAEIRRALGPAIQLSGDPVVLVLPADATVDTRTLTSGTWVEAIRVPGLGRPLLENTDVAAGPAFETWLLADRRRIAGLSSAILREAATARLAAGDERTAIELGSRLVELDEFDEEAHALLVRAYAAAGDTSSAQRHLTESIQMLRRELGVEPSSALVRALERTENRATSAHPSGPSAITALIDAGRAAVNAGAIDAGLETLRRAVADARAAGDQTLAAIALLALGVSYVHGVRGRDGEGATALHASLGLAENLADATIISEATRELGYVEFLRGRYDRAQAWLERAIISAPSEVERAAAQGVLGAVRSDQGRTAESIEILRQAADIGRRAAKPRDEGWALTFLGRAHLLREEFPAAREALSRALEICRGSGWVSMAPFPQALLGCVDLAVGSVEVASEAFDSAFAFGCQIGDPCWEGMGARGIGMVHITRGEIDEGIGWIDDARIRCVRIPDAYLWIQGFCLDALCTAAVQYQAMAAPRWIADLEALSARTGMRELLVRAYLHRAALGETAARETAALFAREIDNPAVKSALPEAAAMASAES